MMSKEQRKIVGITALGGALEFYDFTIYALFSPYISHHFFANTNNVVGLIETFAVFALGYFARPLGGIVFGHLGDKFGRKSAFSLSVFIMAIATLLMGLLPSFQSIGVLAPILLMGLRLMQGFSVGGEIPGAAVFTIEHVAPKKRGVSIGIVFMCITLGNTLGAIVGVILTQLLNQEQMLAWGWRIPFILGFFLGIISYIIRKNMIETPIFTAMLKEKKLQQMPFFRLLTLHQVKLIQAFFLTAATSSIISLFLYLPTYLTNISDMTLSQAYVINVMSFLVFAVMTAVFGYCADHIDRKKLMLTGTILLMALSYPLFYGFMVLGKQFVWVFTLGVAVIGSMINGSYVVVLTESFPANIRYSGVGFSYSLGVAIFGGLAPLTFTWLIRFFATLEAPALYVFCCAALTFLAILAYQYEEKTQRSTQAIAI